LQICIYYDNLCLFFIFCKEWFYLFTTLPCMCAHMQVHVHTQTCTFTLNKVLFLKVFFHELFWLDNLHLYYNYLIYQYGNYFVIAKHWCWYRSSHYLGSSLQQVLLDSLNVFYMRGEGLGSIRGVSSTPLTTFLVSRALLDDPPRKYVGASASMSPNLFFFFTFFYIYFFFNHGSSFYFKCFASDTC